MISFLRDILSPLTILFCCDRYSRAKWIPSSSLPSICQVPGLPGADGDADRVELLPEFGGGNVLPHGDAGFDNKSLLDHDVHAPVDDLLVELEVRDAEAEVSAHAVCGLEEDYGVARPVQHDRRRPGPRARRR